MYRPPLTDSKEHTMDMLITLWNTVPDATRMLVFDTPLVTVLRVLALLTGNTFFEDGSIG